LIGIFHGKLHEGHASSKDAPFVAAPGEVFLREYRYRDMSFVPQNENMLVKSAG
jgi:hypothetical protein